MTTRKTSSAVYLACLEFISGEQGQIFYHTLKARSLKDAENRFHEYLRTYYSEKSEKDGDTYLYLDGLVAVTLLNIEKLPSSLERAYERLESVLSIG